MAFTAAERTWAGAAPERFARLWALKEAMVKALGTGFDGIGWTGVEIDVPGRRIRLPAGHPWPWRWRITEVIHRNHVVTTAADPALMVAVGLYPVPPDVGYRQRSSLLRATGDAVLRALTSATEPASWARTPDEQPTVHVDRMRYPVSLSHGPGLVAAAAATVAGPSLIHLIGTSDEYGAQILLLGEGGGSRYQAAGRIWTAPSGSRRNGPDPNRLNQGLSGINPVRKYPSP